MRNMFSTQTRSLFRRRRATRDWRTSLERLEDRQLLSTLSVSDASAIEGSSALKFIDRFVADGSGGLDRPRASTFGPDGNGDGAQDLYVPSVDTNQILRYDGVTGNFLDVFVTAGSGGLNGPGDLKFAPDGNLYVTSYAGNQLLRYNGTTGAFVDTIASGLSSPLGITVAADGSLYIANQGTNEVLHYDASGLSVFVSAGNGGLSQPRRAVFGPDGNLYVASQGTGQVLRYNGLTGAFLNTFATTGSTPGPAWLQFGTDGYLYTTARTSTAGLATTIIRFNASTGAFVDSLDIGRDSWSFMVDPNNIVYYSGNGGANYIERYGHSSLAAFSISLDSASAVPVTVDYATATGSAVAGADYVTTAGTLTFAPGQTTRTVLVPTVNDSLAESTETFTLNLSNPSGATIADGQCVATIYDDDTTKFYVVNDASSVDQTYQYGRTGNSLASSVQNSGDTAPRGAASTAAGTTVWVVDANKKVYVYNTSGGLLGSWTAGTLNGSAAVEGIATNGTDIWIVDAKQDKVFRYTGAASLRSGSQNAASSFSLNSGNANPKDIVTDGTSLWVVNDASTDKVFKYNLSGSLLGSWTITGAGSAPTGITLDPSNVSNLWIVDSGTDRIYQFDNAASRTSGSQSPSTSFALAAGNTNPQGIADPPSLIPAKTAAASPKSIRLTKSASSSLVLSALAPSTELSLAELARERILSGAKRSRSLLHA
jgi:streptogramin lyase